MISDAAILKKIERQPKRTAAQQLCAKWEFMVTLAANSLSATP